MSRRRKKYRKRKGNLSKQVRSNTAMVRRIKSSIEKKWRDQYWASQECNTTGTLLFLNPALQGDEHDDRTGDYATIKSIKLRGLFHNDHGTPTDCIVRVIIFRQKDVEGTAPTTGDILDNSTITQYYLAFQEKTVQENFVVYFDHTFAMDTTQHSFVPWKYMKRLNMKTNYSLDNAGTIADVSSNALWLLVLSSVSGTTNNPQVNIGCRMEFTDA